MMSASRIKRQNEDNAILDKAFYIEYSNRLDQLLKKMKDFLGLSLPARAKDPVSHPFLQVSRELQNNLRRVDEYIDSSNHYHNYLMSQHNVNQRQQTLKSRIVATLPRLEAAVLSQIPIVAKVQKEIAETFTRSFFYPKTYFEMKATHVNPLSEAIHLFRDYSFLCIFRGHWNRHHTASADLLVEKLTAIIHSGANVSDQVDMARVAIVELQNTLIMEGTLGNKPVAESSFMRRINFSLNELLVKEELDARAGLARPR
jgi:hypothetical protein